MSRGRVRTSSTRSRRRGPRRSRGRVLARRWTALLCVLAACTAGYVAAFTSLLGVRVVEVSGLERVDEAAVTELAAVPAEHPLVRVNTGGIEQRVGGIDEVASVEVARSWPDTVTIDVTERTPVAHVVAADAVWLIDREGAAFHEVDAPPEELPRLDLAVVSAEDPSTRATLDVLTGLPDELRESVVTAAAESPGSVQLELTGGETVRWGDAEQADRKARVLKALLTQQGTEYDISSPELPTVS